MKSTTAPVGVPGRSQMVEPSQAWTLYARPRSTGRWWRVMGMGRPWSGRRPRSPRQPRVARGRTPRSGLLPLVDARHEAGALLRGERLRALLAGPGEADLQGVAVKLIDARHGLV